MGTLLLGLDADARPVYLMRHHVKAYHMCSRPGFPAPRQAGLFPSSLPARFLVSMAATEGPIPTAEEKNRIITARKELIQALVKRRALDKQLVC